MLSFVVCGIKIRVAAVLLVVIPFWIALGFAGQFLFLFTAVTVHELAHILAAHCFGLQAEGMDVTPIGERAVIQGGEMLAFWQRMCIPVVGPVVSLALAGVCSVLPFAPDGFVRMNLAIGWFNLLPFNPLDGGRIAEILLARIFGAPRACRAMCVLSRCGGVALMGVGVLQMILFPLNLSLFCIGVYIYKTTRAAHLTQTFAIYRDMVVRGVKKDFDRPLVVKMFSARGDMPVKAVYARMNWDTYHVYRLYATNHEVTESEILAFIRENGLRGTFMDCLS